MTILLIPIGAVLGTGLLWAASTRLEESTHRLSARYGIPDAVRGSVLLAIASSMPELATAILALTVHGDFELGISAVVGSAIYNILVIPAFSVLARQTPMRSNKELLYREAQFYLVAVITLMLILSMAVIYYGPATTVIGERRVFQGVLTRGLAFVPLALYCIYLLIQFQEMTDTSTARPRDPGVKAAMEWIAVLFSIILILVGVEILLRVAVTLGDLLGTPTFLWGMTVIAAATSLPDTFVSVKAAMAGRIQASVSNVLGSNVFDLLVAVPLAVMVAGPVPINFTQIVPMMSFLVFATITMLLLMRRRLELTVGEAKMMLVLYLVFGVWMASEAFGLTNLLYLR